MRIKITIIFHFIFFLMKEVITIYHAMKGNKTTIMYKINLVLKIVTSVTRNHFCPIKIP